MRELAIGLWWAPCCLHDLQQIETEDDLTEALEEEPFEGAWDTCAEAVNALAPQCDREELEFLVAWYRGKGDNQQIAAEIERYLKEQA